MLAINPVSYMSWKSIVPCIATAIACTFALLSLGSERFSVHHLEHRGEWRSARYLHNLTGGEYDDALVINVSRENQRVADLYRLAPDSNGVTNWRHAKTWNFDEDVIGFDAVKTPTGTRLLIARIDSFYLLDLDTMEEDLILERPAIFRMAPYAELPKLSLALDLNNDELSDLTIPDFDGYWIAFQSQNGSFDRVQKLPVKPGLVTGMAWSYRQRQINRLDFDGDGKEDLGFWDRGEFIVYLGRDQGFATEAIHVDLDLDVQVDENLIVGFGPNDDSVDEENGEERPMRTLERFADINGDEITDALILTVNRSGWFDFRTTYDFHFGSRVDERTIFSSEPNASVGGNSTNSISEIQDFNNDGEIDVLAQGAKLSIGALVRFLLTRSFAVRHDFYLMQAGEFPDDPSYSFTSRVDVDFSSFDVDGWNNLDVGELNGDGFKDLIVSELKSRRVKVHYGIDDPKLFEKQAEVIDMGRELVQVDMVQVRDLNDDEKDDILIYRKDGLTSIISH